MLQAKKTREVNSRVYVLGLPEEIANDVDDPSAA